jgi:hypothetical protein
MQFVASFQCCTLTHTFRSLATLHKLYLMTQAFTFLTLSLSKNRSSLKILSLPLHVRKHVPYLLKLDSLAPRAQEADPAAKFCFGRSLHQANIQSEV